MTAPAPRLMEANNMFTPSDDEIAQFFEELTPEDFLSAPETTAIDTDTELYPRHGEEEYERFVLENLADLLEDSQPFAVLHNGDELRKYTPVGADENLGEFLVRIAKEVQSFGAKWLFVASYGQASVNKTFNPNNHVEVEAARRDGRLIDVINWYAESVEKSSEDSRFGIVLTEHGEQKVIQSTFENGANPAFKRVLHYYKG